MCMISKLLSEKDLSDFSEGTGYRIYNDLGAHPGKIDGVTGTRFAVWAPNIDSAKGSVSVIGDFNDWEGSADPMENLVGTGVWQTFVPNCAKGNRYLFQIITDKGETCIKVDPFGFSFKTTDPYVPSNYKETEENATIDREAMGNASIICSSSEEFTWSDDDWLTKRADADPLKEPMSIYELHLGSWKRDKTGKYRNYRKLAKPLVEYVSEMGFTHVEFLPVAEHPYYPSWGYQVTGFFAPTSRYGTPNDFRFLVNALHMANIGVIIDWVAGHFAVGEWALECFDGEPLYEHSDDERSEHPEWGTLEFNYESPEVRGFLIANALYWCEKFHVDGLRVDAVASMLYLDYARGEDWKPKKKPKKYGDCEYYKDNMDPDAVEFFRELNDVVHSECRGVVTIAEESTAWPGVTDARPPENKLALGFNFKWDMGWMNDTLEYIQQEPKDRQKKHHNKLTFAMHYRDNENYLRPLSHDEVVHEKRSLLGKMPGDEHAQFANLRVLLGYQWCLPGKHLLFMGGEIGQHSEWDHGGEIDWDCLNAAVLPRGLRKWVTDLNDRYRKEPALWEADYEGRGFSEINYQYSVKKVISFVRRSGNGEQVLAVFNLSERKYLDYRIGLPRDGRWCEVLNSDAEVYGGRNSGNSGGVHAEGIPWHEQDFSCEFELPPSTCLIFKRV